MLKQKSSKRYCTTWTAVLALVLYLSYPVMAEEESPTADASVTFSSAYIWRGQELSRDSLVIQPSMTVGYKGFAANVWGNLDTDPYVASGPDAKSDWNETDLTLSYGHEFGKLSAELGFIYYALAGTDTDSQEFYLGLGVNTLLSPSLTIYKDVSTYPHWYFLLGVSHAFELTDNIALELSGSVSYLKSEDEDDYPEYADDLSSTGNKFDNLHDGVLSVALPIGLGKYVTVSPFLTYVFPLTDDAENDMKQRSMNDDEDNFFYGGVTVGIAF